MLLKTTLYSTLVLCITISTAIAQQKTKAQEGIKFTINTFFKGIHNRDTALIRSTVTDGVTMQTIEKNKAGVVTVVNDGIAKFMETLITLPASIKTIDERITFEKILVDDVMAVAWVPFTLYFNNTYYSCGVNQFQLVQIGGQWKINFIIDTRRKTCTT